MRSTGTGPAGAWRERALLECGNSLPLFVFFSAADNLPKKRRSQIAISRQKAAMNRRTPKSPTGAKGKG